MLAISVLTMNIALTLVGLSHEKIRDVSAYPVLVAHSVASKHLLQPVTSSATEYKGSLENIHSRIDERPIAVLPLDHGDHLRRNFAFVL